MAPTLGPSRNKNGFVKKEDKPRGQDFRCGLSCSAQMILQNSFRLTARCRTAGVTGQEDCGKDMGCGAPIHGVCRHPNQIPQRAIGPSTCSTEGSEPYEPLGYDFFKPTILNCKTGDLFHCHDLAAVPASCLPQGIRPEPRPWALLSSQLVSAPLGPSILGSSVSASTCKS